MRAGVDFFFYGTLRDRDMLSAVIGRRILSKAMIVARLPGYRCSAVSGRGFPGIVADESSSAEGVFVRNLSVREGQRLANFEGPFYLSQFLAIEFRNGGRDIALVFVPGSGLTLSDKSWDMDEWRRRHKRMFKRRRRAY